MCKILMLMLMTGMVRAQTLTTYTGVIKDLAQQVVTSGQVTFTLSLPTSSTISGTGTFVPSTTTCNINNDGTLSGYVGSIVSGTCNVTMNTALTPPGTVYRICIQPYFNTPGSCFYDYAVTASKDITTVVPTNFNNVQKGLNPYNYLFSSSDFQSPMATTGRTWSNPEFYYAVHDTSVGTTNAHPMGDLTETPILHIESFNNTPNDVSPIYVNHRCSYSTPPESANGGCVGIMAAVSDTATAEHGIMEAINAISQITATDPLVQLQGIELNAFNNSGVDSLLQANGTFTRGPYFGVSSTAGGNNKMVAAFHSSSQGGNSGWQYGFWAENGTEADFLVGNRTVNGSQDGIEVSPLGMATSRANFNSMPIDFRTSYWNGSSPSPFATNIKAVAFPGTNPTQCLNVSFTSPGSVANICNDGSVQIRGISWRTFRGVPSGNCNIGDFATNAAATSASTVMYVCYPANTWTGISVP